jgi:hypothetical protein
LLIKKNIFIYLSFNANKITKDEDKNRSHNQKVPVKSLIVCVPVIGNGDWREQAAC